MPRHLIALAAAALAACGTGADPSGQPPNIRVVGFAPIDVRATGSGVVGAQSLGIDCTLRDGVVADPARCGTFVTPGTAVLLLGQASAASRLGGFLADGDLCFDAGILNGCAVTAEAGRVVQVQPLFVFTIRQVAAGGLASCGPLPAGGTTLCWGGPRTTGTVGWPAPAAIGRPAATTGNFSARPTPDSVPQPLGLTVGDDHVCGLSPTGAGLCWGANDRGQLGDGSTLPATAWRPVADGRLYIAISAAGRATCAIEAATARLYCWGSGDVLATPAPLADRPAETVRPTAIAPSVAFRVVSVGPRGACAVTDAEALLCWGGAPRGDGAAGPALDTLRVPPPAGETWRRVAVGATAACGVTSAGRILCWGSGGPMLGVEPIDGGASPSPLRTPPAGTLAWKGVTVGAFHACALTATGGAIHCWGRNSVSDPAELPTGIGSAQGLLGDGSSTDRPQPVPVVVPMGIAFDQLAAGTLHTCALTANDAPWCWGNNRRGQAGAAGGAPANVLVPTPVLAP